MTGLTTFQKQEVAQNVDLHSLAKIYKAAKRKRHVKRARKPAKKRPVSTFEMLEQLEENLEHLNAREARKRRRELRRRLRQERRERAITLREERRMRRLEARNQRKTAKISKRNAKRLKKIYGDLNPDEINEINKIQPYTGAMKEELERQGVELENPDDPIEVAAKFSRITPEMEQPVNDDVIDDAYSEQDVEGFEGYENFKLRRGRGKGILRAALAVFGGAVAGLANQIEEKQATGAELSPVEQKILEAKYSAIDEAKTQAKRDAGGKLIDYAPYIVLVLLVVLIARG